MDLLTAHGVAMFMVLRIAEALRVHIGFVLP
jgi:hypothetical protein